MPSFKKAKLKNREVIRARAQVKVGGIVREETPLTIGNGEYGYRNHRFSRAPGRLL